MTPIEDFIKQNNLQIPATQTNKWLSKDRFWSLFFWLFMSTGFSIAGFLKHQLNASIFAFCLFVLTIIAAGFILNTFSVTQKPSIKPVSKNFLFSFIMFLTLTTNFVVIACILTDSANPNISFFIGFRVFFILFTPVSIFFLYKNCPIAILFNRNLWQFEDGNYIPSNSSRRMNDESSQRRYSITRSYCPGNMNYNRTHRR